MSAAKPTPSTHASAASEEVRAHPGASANGQTGEGGLPKTYKPAEHEDRVNGRWSSSKAFHPDPAKVLSGEKKPYCIVMPPPNVTGALHLGHALNNTLQDMLTRAHRMMGFETLWMPGTDHAGIATQAVVERRLRAEGKLKGPLKDSMKREEFVAQVQAWKDEYEARITQQLRAMGCSCDYERQRFTMDEICARAVREAFFILFRDGLIYRGKRLVNWDPVLQTAVADDECYDEEIDAAFYYLRYPLVERKQGIKGSGDQGIKGDDVQPVTWDELEARGYPGADQHPGEQQAWVTVATTRPETYLGDTAVAVNPKDPRAKSLRGLFVELPLIGRVIPMIEDDYVVLPAAMQTDPEAAKADPKAVYATGFLKVTPAHDPNDYEIGQRHKLAMINVFAPDASISDKHGWSDAAELRGGHVFLGLTREAARKKVIAEFKARSVGDSGYHLLEETKPYRHSVTHSDRSKAIIEPYLSDQWYVRVTDDRLAGAANRALVSDQRSQGGPALRAGRTEPDRSIVDRLPFPPIRPEGFIGRDPYPAGQPSPLDLIGHRRFLPHLELDGATYFATWRLGDVPPLDAAERDVVMRALRHFDGDRVTIYGVVIMPDHVHCVLRCHAPCRLSDWLMSVRKFSAKEINETRGVRGSLWQDEPFDHIVRDSGYLAEYLQYLAENPVKQGLAVRPSDYRWLYFSPSVLESLSNAAGTECRPTNGLDSSGDGSLRFYPARYAKMYESWHDNIRDWCISRQLWWGHQIPVWSGWPLHLPTGLSPEQHWARLRTWRSQGRLFARSPEVSDIDFSWAPGDRAISRWLFCVRDPNDLEVMGELQSSGMKQDPDVLDTWFSSALWPLSTLGWPEPSQSAQTKELLAAFNPTSVLSTAREIITLWVSRMVMMNRYLMPETRHSATGNRHSADSTNAESRMPNPDSRGSGPVPFRDVFIHAVVQDGDGKRMSKSAGNGVDPLDIIATHGADAMRFTLAQMATNTQDVRMPVSKDPATGRNTSPKFDVGRNFCNKLWNAARFTLSILERSHASGSESPTSSLRHSVTSSLSLPDRWMLSRLAATTKAAETALANYEFAEYVEHTYRLLWWDFCDWYLEAIKPTVDKSPAQQAVLAHALDTILRLLHPVIPFVTEAIWEKLKDIHRQPIAGVTLGPSPTGLLCSAPWPRLDSPLLDQPAERDFESLRELVNAIRNVRSEHQVAPKRRVTLHATAAAAAKLNLAPGLVETLAGIESVVTVPPAKDSPAVAFRAGGEELHLSNLADAIDAGAEKDRLAKQLDQKRKSAAALSGRLSNPGYVDKAPPKLVEESKAQLAKIQEEIAGLEAQAAKLG